MQVKEVIIPAAGWGTRFLPESKVVPKELMPLGDKPMISFPVKEAKMAGISKVVFVLPRDNRAPLDYFSRNTKLENVLKKANKRELLSKLEQVSREAEGINFCSVVQKAPKGDGDAILQAKKEIKGGAFGVLFVDDIFDSKRPAIEQLIKVFSTSQKPVLGLKRVSDDKLSAYGIVKVDKIASRIFKIRDIVEKPGPAEAPSDLAICGRYILTADIFDYLEKTPASKKGEIILVEALKKMLEDGKMIYAYEIEGDWLECGKMVDWMKTNLHICLNHPEYGPIIKEWFKRVQ